jgi:hypothetical protein
MSARRLGLVSVLVLVGMLAGGSQAFAASAPVIEGVSFSNVTSNSATVSAQVNTGELETTYSFQYGTSSAHGAETPTEKLLASGGSATAQLSGLQPNTEYHFRVVIANEDGGEAGAVDTTFSTLPAGIHGLPDGRVFEMVTPVEKEDMEVYVPFGANSSEYLAEGYVAPGLFEAAANGDAVVYQGEPTHDGKAESSGNGLGSAYVATRGVDGGWLQASIQPAGRRETQYKGFSSDLSVGVLEAPDESATFEEPRLPGGAAPVGHEEGYEYFDLYEHRLTEENYLPLFSATPKRLPREFSGVYFDNVGGAYGRGEVPFPQPAPVYAGSSANMSQLLFGVDDDALLKDGGPLEKELAEDVEREIANNQYNDYLYDWDSGRPSLVDVLPDGKIAPDATFGAPNLPNGKRNFAEGNPPDFSHVISSGGSRVFWSALEGEISHNLEAEGVQVAKGLYVRENATAPQSPLNTQGECEVVTDACTVQIDSEVGGGGRFWTASSDGSKVFFTAPNAGNALYEYEINATTGQPGVLTDLTPGVEVQGVIGASESGDYVYYVNNANELFMLHDSGKWEAPVPIATLSAADGDEIRPIWKSDEEFKVNEDGKVGDWVPDIGTRTAEVTPDGQGLVFMSNQSLPVQGFPHGYDNEGQEEVYVYDATEGVLSCVSCSPSGEPPQTSLEAEGDQRAAAFIPVSWSDSYIPTMISGDGDRVFFQSFMPLVSRATDGKLNVYEWEREGTGSCGEGDGADGGCIYLLSGGTSSEPSWLLGASANGSDAFVISKANLTSDADDELYKLFDARVGGVEPLAPPACTGTGCQGVPGAPPVFATPASVTYAGVGNFPLPGSVTAVVKGRARPLTRAQKLKKALKACAAKPRSRRASCESQARKRYGPQNKAKGLAGAKRGRK